MDPTNKIFEELINISPKSEEEAEHITSTVEKMLLEYPSLSQYLKFDSEEREAIRRELKLLGLINNSYNNLQIK